MIYALNREEADALDRLFGREGDAWRLWKTIGTRIGVDFNPSRGPIPSVSRIDGRSIQVAMAPRKMRQRYIIV